MLPNGSIDPRIEYITKILKKICAFEYSIELIIRRRDFSKELLVRVGRDNEFVIEDIDYKYNLDHHTDISRLIKYLETEITTNMPEIYL